MRKMKDLDLLSIEQVIRLPFFYSLEKDGNRTKMWKITFRCNKALSDGRWQLLDEISNNEYIVRYKIIDFNN